MLSGAVFHGQKTVPKQKVASRLFAWKRPSVFGDFFHGPTAYRSLYPMVMVAVLVRTVFPLLSVTTQ